MTEADVLAQLVALLAAGDAAPLTPDELRPTAGQTLPARYTEVWVSEVPGERDRVGRGIGIRQWRVITRAVGDSYANTSAYRARAAAALEDATVTVAGVTSSPIVRAVADDPIAEDVPGWSGPSEWRLYL